MGRFQTSAVCTWVRSGGSKRLCNAHAPFLLPLRCSVQGSFCVTSLLRYWMQHACHYRDLVLGMRPVAVGMQYAAVAVVRST